MPDLPDFKEFLHYDPTTGHFKWKVTVSPRGVAGQRAGSQDSNGYRRIRIFRQRHKEHRLAWLFEYGAMPAERIDHINGDKADNRIVNLRLADKFQNNWNRAETSRNTSGAKGVSWSSSKNRWQAVIGYKNKLAWLGSFDDIESAQMAYETKAAELYGEFYRPTMPPQSQFVSLSGIGHNES